MSWSVLVALAAVASSRAGDPAPFLWPVALEPGLSSLGLSRLAEPGRLQSADAAWANGGIDPFEVFG